MAIPRTEYPRPQLRREDWLNLNGVWEFEFDFGISGRQRELFKAEHLGEKITVPFCPESKLSGIEHKDFIPCVWYRRELELPKAWESGRVILHFGAVDYCAEVYVNGESVGKHFGGYVSFSFDITRKLKSGINVITVCAEDDLRSGDQPRGKQCEDYHSRGCSYTRTTGIWQTVWAEHVPDVYIKGVSITPDVKNEKVDICVKLGGSLNAGGYTIEARSSYEGRPTGSAAVKAGWNGTALALPLSELRLWEPGHGRLYDLELTLKKDGVEIDAVYSYFGMRSVDITDNMITINGKPVFQRLILDQGFYPDGIYTAPSDDELKNDILRAMAMGFNGARLHQKIFEPRYLYWADKLGYLCWGEHANWGLDLSRPSALLNFLPEWTEAVERDYSHPSIIGWCPFNETKKNQEPRILQAVYEVTKRLDPTRPVIDTSGYFHVQTDVYDSHDYTQEPSDLAANYEAYAAGGIPFINANDPATYTGDRPFFVSEFGGIWWAPGRPGWGYGKAPKTEEEFIARYRGLVTTLIQNPKMCAFCYTQLTDVEQEVNGLYTYERTPKFEPKVIAEITSQKAAIEK